MAIKNLKYILPALTGITLSLVLASCAADGIKDEPDPGFSGSSLFVKAEVTGHTSTRAYQEQGIVTSGRYYLTYPQMSDQKYVLGTVDFDGVPSEGLGLAYSANGTELKWSDVGGSPTSFSLDNVLSALNTQSDDPSLVVFGSDNPYKASVFDTTDGTNDLLWGNSVVARDTRTIGFDLHHNMSRVKVLVKIAHVSESVGEIKLENASVKITNLYSEAESYNRLDGSLNFGQEQEMGDIIIVNDNDATPEYKWVKRVDETDTTYYYSPDIVLPPQSLLEDVNRPRLVITLEDGTEYTGILPHAMLVVKPDATNNDLVYPVNLSFLKEHILTIRTIITEEPPQLSFMPVYVTDWVDKGEFTLEAHQAGIYTAEEFSKLIGYYQKNNNYQLVRYGYLFTPDGSSEEMWNFEFFSSVTLDYKTISNKMKPGTVITGKGEAKPFQFSYNNYSVYVTNGDETDARYVSPTQLYRIVTGQLTWENISR